MADAKFKDEMPELAEFREKFHYAGLHFQDLANRPLHTRPLRNNAGAWFELADYKAMEAHISEIGPRGHSHKHRHMFEAVIYIVKGRGHSIIHKELDDKPIRIAWKAGDIFAPPLNWWHQHFNDDDSEPARYLAITDLGLMKTLGTDSKEQAPAEYQSDHEDGEEMPA
ncbi:MAG: cupin domain-containing protein [Chloroflexi bacterium]|nr:cupin domain-containing protein [Chloroflexota bacterium]